MKIINFLSAKADIEIKDTLYACALYGYPYSDVKDIAFDEGYYIPEDQYQAIVILSDTQVELDIGTRQNEVNS